MSLAPTATTTETTEIKLRSALKAKLMRSLRVYAQLRTEVKALEAAMDKCKVGIGAMREEAGVNSLSIEGFHVTVVNPMRSTLDKQKLIAMGVTTEMLEEATVVKPGRPYERISCPGDKPHTDD